MTVPCFGPSLLPHLRQARYGYSLPQAFYIDETLYRADLALLGATQWLLLDHVSRIPAVGDYFVTKFGSESIIVVRSDEQTVNAFYNVCRHRGSLVCLDSSGHAKSFVCPYHAWSYGLDGQLRAAPLMSGDFDKRSNGLKRCHVQVEAGFIFLNLAPGAPPDFSLFVANIRKYLLPHDFATAAVAVRKGYFAQANWKLVVENFLECYHCRSAHRTYCAVHDPDKLLALGAGPGSAAPELLSKYSAQLEAWEAHARATGSPTGMFSDAAQSPYFQGASRIPIGKDHVTETLDGRPVAPLMGTFTAYDAAQTAIGLNPVSYILASNDYAVVFRFTPLGAQATDIQALWLVRAGAVANQDYDPRRLVEVWDVTTMEDKTIVENNALGILSGQYEPGRYAQHETRVSEFGAWYVRRLEELAGGSGTPGASEVPLISEASLT